MVHCDLVQRFRFLLVAVALSTSLGHSAVLPDTNDLRKARDLGDSAALDRLIASAKSEASQKPGAGANYRLAIAYSFAAEVATEKKDKSKAGGMAEAGYGVAQQLTSSDGSNAEYHRLLGNLCGQVIPANPLMGSLKYGPCARDEISKAIELDPKLPMAYVSRGVGNYYLPPQMGGGPERSLSDFDKAIALDGKLADAYLWKGVALRKLNRNAEAHEALLKAVQYAPLRVWAKEQLNKTPAH